MKKEGQSIAVRPMAHCLTIRVVIIDDEQARARAFAKLISFLKCDNHGPVVWNPGKLNFDNTRFGRER